MAFILGQKQQMTQVFQDDGRVVPITVVRTEPNVITALRSKERDGYTAVQLGYGRKSKQRVAKAQQQDWKELGTFRWVREFRMDSIAGLTRGQKIEVSTFTPGDKVDVVSTSKGRGFAGVVKRHHFKGAPASHGHKHDARAPGSIGATFPQHVIKGTRMAGRMGNARTTVKNLRVVAVKPETNEILVSGSVPGPIHGLVMITTV